MQPSSLLLRCSAALTVLAAAPALLAQSTLIIPSDVTATTEGASSTGYPWDRDTATPTSNDIRVQYIYDSTNIPVTFPILISQLRFRANGSTLTWTGGAYSNCEVRIGTSANDYATASTTFDANWGGVSPPPDFSGAATVQPGTGNGSGVPGPWYVTIPLATPVMYDPTSGNDLLIDILHDGTWTGATGGSTSVDTGRNACSRMYNISDWTAATGSLQQSVGITCELTYTPTTGLYPNFTATPTSGVSPMLVQFTDTTFTSDPGGVTAYAWDFDNNGVVDSTVQNPQHTYATGGTYTVKLTTTDATHGTLSETKIDYIVVDPIDANFSFTPSAGAVPLLVQFTDTTTGNPTGWQWDFDEDGVTDSTLQNPSFTYTTGGTFDVKLTTTNGANSDSITIVDAVRALGATNNTRGAELVEYQFNEPSGERVANSASTTAAPSHGTMTTASGSAPVAVWQGDTGRNLWDGNDPGTGAFAAQSTSPWARVETGWLIDIVGSHSISFWTRLPLGTTAGASYAFGGTSGSARCYHLNNNGLSLRSWGNAPTIDAATPAETLTGWNHWVCVIDDTAATGQWYLNGVADGTPTALTAPFAFQNGGQLVIGNYSSTSSAFSRYFDIDDFRVYGRALTTAEIAAIGASENPAATTFGVACSGPSTAPTVSGAGGAPAIGNANFAVEAGNLEPGVTQVLNIGLFTSSPGLPYDLGTVLPATHTGCLAQVFPDAVGVALNGTSSTLVPLPVPNSAVLAGNHVFCQVITLGSVGAVSDVLDVNVQM